MAAYFNSGVLLFDLERVRSAGLMARAREVACRQHDRLLWPDQDALNVAFAGRWLPVHPRWNCMNSLRVWRPWADEALGADAVAEALADPAVVHFEGPALSKPWHYLSDHPLRDRYRSALARTPWAGTPLADRTVATRLIAHLPERWRRDAFGQLLRLRQRRSQ
jgi:lipopolysaccharide biosynthesis glycosyltransferase